MEKEILESISRLQYIGNELGISPCDGQSEEIPENPSDYTERILFSNIQSIKDV